MIDFATPGGARVRVVPAPEHLGEGVLLILTMVSPEDPRRAEVYLDPSAMSILGKGLLDFKLDQHPTCGICEWEGYPPAGQACDHALSPDKEIL